MPRGCVIRIRLWPLRRDDHSGILIGAGGERRFDWPAHVLANDVSTRIDRLHACRHKWQLQEQVNNAYVVVCPLWRGPGNIHNCVLGGNFYRRIQYEDNSIDCNCVQLESCRPLRPLFCIFNRIYLQAFFTYAILAPILLSTIDIIR